MQSGILRHLKGLETPPPDKIGNKAGSDSRASDAGVRFYRGAEKGAPKSQQTHQQLYLASWQSAECCQKRLSVLFSYSFPEYEQHLRKMSSTGEDIRALSKHCIKCGLTGCWEGRSSVPLLLQARKRRRCGSREDKRGGASAAWDPCTGTTAGKVSPCCWQ
jgi:hypothetical protein